MSILILFVVFVPISLHSHVFSIPLFNRLNFFELSEQVQFYLGVLNLDLTFQIDKPTLITDENRNNEKAWER